MRTKNDKENKIDTGDRFVAIIRRSMSSKDIWGNQCAGDVLLDDRKPFVCLTTTRHQTKAIDLRGNERAFKSHLFDVIQVG